MVIAGFIAAFAVVGGTIITAQSGVFASSGTAIQANGEINVVQSVPAVAPAETGSNAASAQQPDSRSFDVITVTGVASVQYVTNTVYIQTLDTSLEAELTAKLSQAYKMLQDRDAAYQLKLQEAYSRLAALQAVGQSTATSQTDVQSSAVNSVSRPQVQSAPNTSAAAVATPVTSKHGDKQNGNDSGADEQRPQDK
jgi:hypothetical protein